MKPGLQISKRRAFQAVERKSAKLCRGGVLGESQKQQGNTG